jgi:adenylosuccinate lyase
MSWQSQRDRVAELASVMALMAGTAARIANEIYQMNKTEVGELAEPYRKGLMGSSTMPHKVNPINFENSEANCGIAISLLQHLAEKLPVSRLQRDLSDSSALRNIGVAVGHSLVAIEAARRGLGRLAVDEAAAARDLESAWEVLGEAVQVVMRRHGLPDSYEQLKDLTRGRSLTREILHQFITGLALPAEARDYLLALTPQSYVGSAANAVRHINPTHVGK